MKLGIVTIVGALAACFASPPTGEVQEEALACTNKPHVGPCEEAVCDGRTRTWLIDTLPEGTECGRGGTCDAGGRCVGEAPPPNPPTVPTNLHFAADTPNSFTLAWNPSANATGYNVVATNGWNATYTTTTATIDNLSPATRTCFTVTAVGPGGATAAPQLCGFTPIYASLANITNTLPYSGGPNVPFPLNAVVDSIELRADANSANLVSVFLVPQANYPFGGTCDHISGYTLFVGDGGIGGASALAFLYGSASPLLEDVIVEGCNTPVENVGVVWLTVHVHY